MQFLVGAASVVFGYGIYKLAIPPVEQKFSWTQCDLPNGYHVTISFYGQQSLNDVINKHQAIAPILKGAPITFTANKFAWYGRNKDIGVIELSCSPALTAMMQNHYNAHATKDHGDLLKLHMTLHEGDNPEDFIGKSYTSTSVSSWFGKTYITTPLVKPDKKQKLIKTE